jgi:D-xylose transport system substrate-binding protein
VAAFKAGGGGAVPPVTGNDATLAGLQLIINGDQYNTISKPSEIEAAAAADAAVKLLQGQTPVGKSTLFNTPSQLFTPIVVTQQNLKAVIVTTGIQKASALCTSTYAAACTKLGIS